MPATLGRAGDSCQQPAVVGVRGRRESFQRRIVAERERGVSHRGAVADVHRPSAPSASWAHLMPPPMPIHGGRTRRERFARTSTRGPSRPPPALRGHGMGCMESADRVAQAPSGAKSEANCAGGLPARRWLTLPGSSASPRRRHGGPPPTGRARSASAPTPPDRRRRACRA